MEQTPKQMASDRRSARRFSRGPLIYWIAIIVVFTWFAGGLFLFGENTTCTNANNCTESSVDPVAS